VVKTNEYLFKLFSGLLCSVNISRICAAGNITQANPLGWVACILFIHFSTWFDPMPQDQTLLFKFASAEFSSSTAPEMALSCSLSRHLPEILLSFSLLGWLFAFFCQKTPGLPCLETPTSSVARMDSLF